MCFDFFSFDGIEWAKSFYFLRFSHALWSNSFSCRVFLLFPFTYQRATSSILQSLNINTTSAQIMSNCDWSLYAVWKKICFALFWSCRGKVQRSKEPFIRLPVDRRIREWERKSSLGGGGADSAPTIRKKTFEPEPMGDWVRAILTTCLVWQNCLFCFYNFASTALFCAFWKSFPNGVFPLRYYHVLHIHRSPSIFTNWLPRQPPPPSPPPLPPMRAVAAIVSPNNPLIAGFPPSALRLFPKDC